MKNMPDTFSIVSRVYKYLLSKKWLYTVSGTFLEVQLANMHRWNIFLIEALSMFASPQIKMVKPPDKKRGISDRSSFCVGLALNSRHQPGAIFAHSVYFHFRFNSVYFLACCHTVDRSYWKSLKKINKLEKTINLSERVNCKNMSSQNFIIQSVTGLLLAKIS